MAGTTGTQKSRRVALSKLLDRSRTLVNNGWRSIWRILSLLGLFALLTSTFLYAQTLLADWQSAVRWHSFTERTPDNLVIFVEAPEAVGRTVPNEMHIGVQNLSDQKYSLVRVFILGDNKIWFPNKNYVEFDSLPKGLAQTSVLTYTVSPALPDSAKTVTVTIAIDSETLVGENSSSHFFIFQDSPSLAISHTIEGYEAFDTLLRSGSGGLSTLEGLVTIVASTIAGFALLRGNLQNLIRPRR